MAQVEVAAGHVTRAEIRRNTQQMIEEGRKAADAGPVQCVWQR
jgi:hypothetical protein